MLRRATVLCAAAAVLVLTGSGGVSSAVGSGSSSAEAFAIQVSVPGQGGSTAGAVSAPPDAVGVGGAFAFPADGSIAQAASISSSVSASGANSEAEVSVSGLSLFGGEVTVASITVRANAQASSKAASGGTAGSSVTGMAVAGAPVASGPGSSVSLGDWGTATILQQSSSPYGSRKARGFNAGATALQVHVNVEHAGVPAGTDIVVGYADVAAEALEPQPVGGSRDDTQRPIRPRRRGRPRSRERAAGRRLHRCAASRRTSSRASPQAATSSRSTARRRSATRSTRRGPRPVGITAKTSSPRWAPRFSRSPTASSTPSAGTRSAACASGSRTLAGNEFYYAHLSAFSPLAINGAQVRAGDVIGFVGNTGDAEHTPYHLHFEIHPASLLYRGYDGSAVPPHPYLLAWKRLTDLPFTSVSGWAPPLSDSSRAPRPGAILLQSRDISTGSGLEPGSLRARDARGRRVRRRRRARRSGPASTRRSARSRAAADRSLSCSSRRLCCCRRPDGPVGPSSPPSSLSVIHWRVAGPVTGLKRMPRAMPAMSRVAFRRAVLLLPLHAVGGLAQVIDRALEVLLDVLVGGDPRGDRRRRAAAQQLVVDVARGCDRALDVLADLLVLQRPGDVGLHVGHSSFALAIAAAVLSFRVFKPGTLARGG